MTIGSFSRGVAASLVVFILMTSGSGCFGPFNLTRNVYNWNGGIKGSGEVNDKWMKEIVFFGMIVIPVYMFSALLDAFVFNAIQFWSGSNPVKVTQGPDGFVEAATSGESTIEFSWSTEHRRATVAYRRHGELIKIVTLEAEGNAYRMIDDWTGASYHITADAAGVRIVDAHCRLVAGIPHPSHY
ncbi:MAG TPA: DUF3332 family protein [Nitrospira sp.]|nr:DUF3332 family protein [Nitrospira sp.]